MRVDTNTFKNQVGYVKPILDTTNSDGKVGSFFFTKMSHFSPFITKIDQFTN